MSASFWLRLNSPGSRFSRAISRQGWCERPTRPSRLDGQSYRGVSTETSLVPELRNALKQAMKSRDLVQRDVLKSVIGDIQTSQHLANAPSALKILKSAVNKRLEAARATTTTNPPRVDLEELYLTEAKILEGFIPADMASMSPEELLVTVRKVVEQLNFSNEDRVKALGRVVKAVRDITGDRADGKEIAVVVKKVLESSTITSE